MKEFKGKRLCVKTLQTAEPPYSVSNGLIKTNSENIGKWRMIYKIGHRISILLNLQRKEKGVDSMISRTQRIFKFMTIDFFLYLYRNETKIVPALHCGHVQANQQN